MKNYVISRRLWLKNAALTGVALAGLKWSVTGSDFSSEQLIGRDSNVSDSDSSVSDSDSNVSDSDSNVSNSDLTLLDSEPTAPAGEQLPDRTIPSGAQVASGRMHRVVVTPEAPLWVTRDVTIDEVVLRGGSIIINGDAKLHIGKITRA